MTTVQLRRHIKKRVDAMPAARLRWLADYMGLLSRPRLKDRLAKGERDLAAGRGVNWRSVRRDV